MTHDFSTSAQTVSLPSLLDEIESRLRLIATRLLLNFFIFALFLVPGFVLGLVLYFDLWLLQTGAYLHFA